MNIIKKIGRVLLILIAVLVILGSIAGIIVAWKVNLVATDATTKAFAVADQAVTKAQSRTSQADALITQGRTEVQQAEDTVGTIGANLQANSPVLTALGNRLETRLAPSVAKIQEVLAPARDAFVTIKTVVDIATAVPGVAERSPGLVKLDEALAQVEQTAADVRQLNDTLKASVVEGKNTLTQEAVTTLTGLTTRIDDRLGQAQSALQTVQSDLEVFQDELEATKSRLLGIYDLAALGTTLLMLWIIYSQVVVIRHHWHGLRGVNGGATAAALPPAATAAQPTPLAEPSLASAETPWDQPGEAVEPDDPPADAAA